MIQQFHDHREAPFIHRRFFHQKTNQSRQKQAGRCLFTFSQYPHRLRGIRQELFFHKVRRITGIELTNGIYGQWDCHSVRNTKIEWVILHRFFPKPVHHGSQNIAAKIHSDYKQIKNRNGF